MFIVTTTGVHVAAASTPPPGTPDRPYVAISTGITAARIPEIPVLG
jgi:hypothetical protein